MGGGLWNCCFSALTSLRCCTRSPSCLTRYILGLASFFVSNPLLVVASPLEQWLAVGLRTEKPLRRKVQDRSLTILGCHHLGAGGKWNCRLGQVTGRDCDCYPLIFLRFPPPHFWPCRTVNRVNQGSWLQEKAVIKIESPVVARELLARYSGLARVSAECAVLAWSMWSRMLIPRRWELGQWFSWVKVEKRRLENSLNICTHILYFSFVGGLRGHRVQPFIWLIHSVS